MTEELDPCPTCGAVRRTEAGAKVCSDGWHHECDLLQPCDVCCRPAIMPRPPNVRLSVKRRTTGPKEDPYDITTRTVTFLDTGRRVVLERDSFAEAVRLSGDNVGTEEAERHAEDGGAAYRRLIEEFEELTGLDEFSFDWHYYSEEGEIEARVHEAELVAGWDPNP